MNINKGRILVFSTAYFPLIGGAEVAIKEITGRLEGEYEFDLICARMRREFPSYEKIEAVRVHRIGLGITALDKLLLPFLGAIKAILLNRKHKYLLWWCMMASFGSGAAYIANLLHFWNKVPIVLTLQEGDSPSHIKKRRCGLVGVSWRLALRNTRLVTVISSYLGDMARMYGYRGKMFLIPNGVDVDRFSQDAPHAALERISKKLGKKESDVFLVTTSRLVRKNAVDMVIRSLEFLPKNVKFLVLGTGSEHLALMDLAKDIDVEDRVLFCGQQNHQDIPIYLKLCDIFIRPSRSEGMGNSFVEAMASNIPVVGTPVGGIVDFLVDGETGLFCDVDSPDSIADAVTRMLGDDALRKKVTENAKKMVTERYDWDIISRCMKEDVFSVFERV